MSKSAAKDMYAKAYAAHYKAKDYQRAYNLYLEVIASHPSSPEYGYAKSQIANLEKTSPTCCVPTEANLAIAAELHAAVAELELREQEKCAEYRQAIELKERRRQEVEKLASKMMYTTCGSLEGYKVTKQLGLVYGEVLFKANILDRVVADIKNIGDFLKLWDTEMSGSMDLLSAARDHAIRKMTHSAAEKGANAIIGIDMESSFAGMVTHITVTGTAVLVEDAG